MQTKVALVGIGGYGNWYVNELLKNAAQHGIQFAAGIDPAPERCSRYNDLKEAGIPIFPDLETFYQSETADLVIICAPIHLHRPLSILALSKGSNVLCEKPIGATLEDAQAMMEAEQKYGRFIAIGYQWSYTDAILALKRDLLAGRFGKPLRFKSMVLWPRSHAYYHRNNWAGRIRSVDGVWVLDSPVNNAAAHYLHNMLFLLGKSLELSARPDSLQAELYRANRIENYDTASMRVMTEENIPLLFTTAHPIQHDCGPLAHYELEDAVIEYPSETEEFIVRFRNGQVERYGSPTVTSANKIWQAAEAVHTGNPVVCSIRTALPHMMCVLGAQEAGVKDFPQEMVKLQEKEDGDRLTWVEGLEDALVKSYKQDQMPSEMGEYAWAEASPKIDLHKYGYLLK